MGKMSSRFSAGGRKKARNRRKRVQSALFVIRLARFACFLSVFWGGIEFACAQQNFTPQISARFSSGQSSSGNYLKNSAAFRQEIMRMEINVVRGARVLPITQVPRVRKGDIIRMHLLDEAAGGIKPSESLWNWTFLVAFINPNRKSTTGGGKDGINPSGGNGHTPANNIGDQSGTVSEEIQFRRSGWYKEYSFVVPYDSQPVFFLYPKPKYRGQILKLVNRNYEEVRKLGEKTIELADAYSRINSFLTEMQSVLYRTQSSYYGSFITYPQLPGATAANPYGTSGIYNPYGTSSIYNPYGTSTVSNPYGTTGATTGAAAPVYNYNAFFEQTVERLAASFNINLPSCWQTTNGGYNYFGTPGGGYNSGYGSSYGSTYGSYGTYGSAGNSPTSFGHAVSSEFIGRAQCVAKNIRIEDFDLSVGRMLREGAMFALTQLRDKYPQLAYYINLAAVAIEFIVKIFQKYPLKIVPTIIQTSDNNGYGNPSGGGGTTGNNGGYSSSPSAAYPPGSSASVSANAAGFAPVKISVYAESQPSDTDQVTAYPVVIHKWQSEPDPEVISLAPPVPAEPCLHAGQNILKSADISDDEAADKFTRDFKLNVTSSNGFAKAFPLKKNQGAGGWELDLTNEDLNSFPKLGMTLEAEVTGTRGFNEIRSPQFVLPLNTGNNWQLKPEAQQAFAVGGKRLVTLQNLSGSCRCLQAVIYKPSFGGQFVFEAEARNPANLLLFAPDGREVSFEVDATNFQPGAGTLELKTYGDLNQPNNQNQAFNQGGGQNGQSNILPIKLYPAPPEITDFRIAGGDRQAVIAGSRLEQLQWVKVNGKRMRVVGSDPATSQNKQANQNGQANQPAIPPNNQSPNLPLPNSAVAGQSVGQTTTLPNAFSPDPASSIALNPNERLLVFEDPGAKQEGGSVALELGLSDERSFAYPGQFKVKPSRPAIITRADNEIEGVIVEGGNAQPKQTGHFPAAASLPLFSVDTREISVNLQNARTDYDFKPENLSVETRIENGGASGGEMPRVSFEVFDWKSMRLTITLNEQLAKIIGGRRLQFRLRDRERGTSDWYTIRQTFVRIPEIKSVGCTSQMNGQCEIKGYGIEYIGQVSVDGGKTWFPNENQSLQTRQTTDGQSAAMIPRLENKKLLLIKFRDFPKMDGTGVTDFIFSNSVKATGTHSRRAKEARISNQPVNLVEPNLPNGSQLPNTPQNPNLPNAVPSANTFQNQAVSPGKIKDRQN